MRRLGLFFLLLFALTSIVLGQGQETITVRFKPLAGGGGFIIVNAASQNTGASNTLVTGAWHPVTGNHLVVIMIANDATTTHTCTDNAAGGSNTYVKDGAQTATALGITYYHVKTISNTGAGSLTITCNGTTPAIHAFEYSGGTGDLDTASAGGTGGNAIIGATQAGVVTSIAPGAFTPTTAATILVDGMGSTDGGAITSLTQTDALYTSRGTPCTNGGSCFISAMGTRIVTGSASYTDGWSWTTGIGPVVAMNAAYK